MSTVFFTDRDLGAKMFPGRLRAGGLTVEVHNDHFAPDALDEDWLPVVAGFGWVVLTNDQKIMRRALERDALMTAGAAAFVLVGGDAPASELADNFLNTVGRVDTILETVERPFIAKVYRPSPKTLIAAGRAGSVDVKLTLANWTPQALPGGAS